MSDVNEIFKDTSPDEGQEELEETTASDEEQADETPELAGLSEEDIRRLGGPEKAVKAYRELQAELTRRAQRESALSSEVMGLKQQMNALLASLQQTQKPGSEAKPMSQEEWAELLLSGPEALDKRVDKLVEQRLAERLAPLEASSIQSHFDRQVANLKGTPDFETYKPVMIELYRQFPALAALPMELVLAQAKGLVGDAIGSKSPEEQEAAQASKSAARLPASSGRRLPKDKPFEEAFVDSIFETPADKWK